MAERVAGLTFGEVADDFDRVRPTYPAELVDDVCAGVPPSGRALEVGAGTGKATAAFAARGLSIVAIEPDPAMAAILARTVSGVAIERMAFEEYVATEEFDLLYSADAWHWTRPDTRWELAARALAPDGVLALFWNNGRVADPGQRQSMMDIYAAVAPAMEVHDETFGPDEAFTVWPGNELVRRAEFVDPVARIHPWQWTVTGADFVTHTSTRSQVRMLDPATRERLLVALADALGDEVTLAVDSVLYLARRRVP